MCVTLALFEEGDGLPGLKYRPVDRPDRVRVAGGGRPHLTVEIIGLPGGGLDRDLEVWSGQRRLQIVAGGLQVTGIAGKVAPQGR